jgi:hypothetical protein
VKINAPHAPHFPQWEHSAETAEATAQAFLDTAAALGSAVRWMSANAYKCEQAKLNPDLVDVLTGDAALDVLSALRGFAMALDRAALVKFGE